MFLNFFENNEVGLIFVADYTRLACYDDMLKLFGNKMWGGEGERLLLCF